MPHALAAHEQLDLLRRSFTRRAFGRFATLLTAGATLPFYNEPALAQYSMIPGGVPADAVKINANENPLGPCAEAAEAIHNVVKKGGRYMYEETFTLGRTVAEIEGLRPDYVQPYAGSSDPLHRTVLAFCSPARGFVVADPGYEAGARAASYVGARVSIVPLGKDYAHDVRAMVKADPEAGVIYICNPNNPTGTLTSRADIEWALANKPAGSIILLDEAYIHLSKALSENCADLAAKDKDIIVLRTFSKLYGMAGLRAGFAMGRPDLLAKLRMYQAGALPVTAMVGATASLRAKNVVAERRKLIGDVREDVFEFLEKHNISFIRSDSNCFMLDTKRPAGEFIQAMRERKIYVGRVWPSWPTHSRITIGTKEEMQKFESALAEVMA
ncbi:MAG TPA: pyridoxal phosphate-dependent aminotransferase [Bryobacteraceae bacterium]|nr:pyridoxal phosphate-dependent aminotransferase [Bryobacteraceae bacterium]